MPSLGTTIPRHRRECPLTLSSIAAFIWLPSLCVTCTHHVNLLSDTEDYLPPLNVRRRDETPAAVELRLSHLCHSVGQLLELREDIYALGENAKNIGRLLNRVCVDLPGPLNLNKPSASMVIVDRVSGCHMIENHVLPWVLNP